MFKRISVLCLLSSTVVGGGGKGKIVKTVQTIDLGGQTKFWSSSLISFMQFLAGNIVQKCFLKIKIKKTYLFGKK